jgi:predicted transcriptional regulator
MSTTTLELASRDATAARFADAMNGKPQGAYISFDSAEMLFQVLTPSGWHIIRSMTGAGPLSVQELAARCARI